MENMLLAEGDECRLFRDTLGGSGGSIELNVTSEDVSVPAVR